MDPQGSILSPTHFTIKINDIVNLSHRELMLLYSLMILPFVFEAHRYI